MKKFRHSVGGETLQSISIQIPTLKLITLSEIFFFPDLSYRAGQKKGTIKNYTIQKEEVGIKHLEG